MTGNIRYFILNWLPLIIWSIVIFSFSNTSQPDVGPTYWTNFVAKKIAHIIEYAILGVLAYRAFNKNWKLALIFVILYGASDEFHQSFIPGREPRVRDVIIDTGGGLFGLWIKKYIPLKVQTLLGL